MSAALLFVLLPVAAMALWLGWEIYRAPDGWQDWDGFHAGRPTSEQHERERAFEAGLTRDDYQRRVGT